MKNVLVGALSYNFLCGSSLYHYGYPLGFLLAVRVAALLDFLYGPGMPFLSGFLLVLLRLYLGRWPFFLGCF